MMTAAAILLLAAGLGLLAWQIAALRTAVQHRADQTIGQNNLQLIEARAQAAFGPPVVPRDDGFLVSLTTTPDRLGLAHSAIEALLLQNRPPADVCLYVSDAVRPADVPARLRRLEEHGLMLRFVPDIGPHMKLTYALAEHPGRTIITADDDMLYPPSMTQVLLEHAEAFPGCIVANWARTLHFDLRGRVRPVRSGRLLTPARHDWDTRPRPAPVPSLRSFGFGFLGVLYPPGALHGSVGEVETFQRLCPREDDIWFKAMSILAGTPTVHTNLGVDPQHLYVPQSQRRSLRRQNTPHRGHLEQLRATFDALDLYTRLNERA